MPTSRVRSKQIAIFMYSRHPQTKIMSGLYALCFHPPWLNLDWPYKPRIYTSASVSHTLLIQHRDFQKLRFIIAESYPTGHRTLFYMSLFHEKLFYRILSHKRLSYKKSFHGRLFYRR